MRLSGHNLADGHAIEGTGEPWHGIDPESGERLDPVFRDADATIIDRAARAAEEAFRTFGHTAPAQRARLLRTVADAIVALGDTLLHRARAETALPLPRLVGERGRTVGQLRLFAEVLEEGSWIDARIDPGDPDRLPLPRPDVRRMLIPLGPVAVFGASNFPLAFSVAGGDTASALAAGCTIVCKAHPAHPATSELVARAILDAVRACGLPAGTFNLVHGASHAPGLQLVRHPLITAIGFTGSGAGGRAIFDAAAARPVPVPVYAEMGSTNPVFLLPSALDARGDAIADALAQSITQGVGQFCTNPGVLLGLRGRAFDRFRERLAERIDAAPAGVMLTARMAETFAGALARGRAAGATPASAAADGAPPAPPLARPALLALDAGRFAADASLREEIFGPASILVTADDAAGLERVADALDGQLTATIHGTPDDLLAHARLIRILERKVGRIIFNGVPTGVEVGHAMHHGGPWPATSDLRTTSVGSAAITRFARPVCYQDFPGDALPPALRDRNELGIWRTVLGHRTRQDVGSAHSGGD